MKRSIAEDVGLGRHGFSPMPTGEGRWPWLKTTNERLWTAYGLSITVVAILLGGQIAWIAWRTTGMDVWLTLVIAASIVLVFTGLQDLGDAFFLLRTEDRELRQTFQELTELRQERRRDRATIRAAFQALKDEYLAKDALPWWALGRQARRIRSFSRDAKASAVAAVTDNEKQH